MSKLPLKLYRYVRTYRRTGPRCETENRQAVVDYCVDRPVLMAQVRSEILGLGEIIKAQAPVRSLEIGTNYGGTLLLLCSLSAPDAQIISIDLPSGRFGGGYPKRKIPLYRQFPKSGQQLHLIRGDSPPSRNQSARRARPQNQPLDYLFLDGDHTYEGVRQDFEMYSPLVRSGGIIAFHDIAKHAPDSGCDVDKFWNEIKTHYRHQEFIENPKQGLGGIGILFVP